MRTIRSMSVGSQKVTEDIIVLSIGIMMNVIKHWKVLLTFTACALGAYFGYSSNPQPVQTGDPIAWISFGCLGMAVLLFAYIIWKLMERTLDRAQEAHN